MTDDTDSETVDGDGRVHEDLPLCEMCEEDDAITEQTNSLSEEQMVCMFCAIAP